jgi:hypothetical protein
MAVINDNRQGLSDPTDTSHSLTSVLPNEHAVAYLLRCIDGATSTADGEAFTVNLAERLGYTQRGWYDEVGPLISYGVKAENLKSKLKLYAQVRRVLARVTNRIASLQGCCTHRWSPHKRRACMYDSSTLQGCCVHAHMCAACWSTQ